MQIEGTSAVVTGGASGLGAATVRALADKGAKVAIFDVNLEAAQALASEIGGIAVEADVTSEESLNAAFDKVEAAHGTARIVVNCAGIGTAGRLVGRDGPMPFENFERVQKVNLFGTFNIMRLAAHRMSVSGDGGGGVIINTASVAAFEGQIGQVAYSASKGAIVAMALPAARELARFGIRVNTIAPGIFHTPLLDTLPPEGQAALAEGIPFPARLGDPKEFAQTALFIAENDYVNAEVIRLDAANRLKPK